MFAFPENMLQTVRFSFLQFAVERSKYFKLFTTSQFSMWLFMSHMIKNCHSLYLRLVFIVLHSPLQTTFKRWHFQTTSAEHISVPNVLINFPSILANHKQDLAVFTNANRSRRLGEGGGGGRTTWMTSYIGRILIGRIQDLRSVSSLLR